MQPGLGVDKASVATATPGWTGGVAEVYATRMAELPQAALPDVATTSAVAKALEQSTHPVLPVRGMEQAALELQALVSYSLEAGAVASHGIGGQAPSLHAVGLWQETICGLCQPSYRPSPYPSDVPQPVSRRIASRCVESGL